MSGTLLLQAFYLPYRNTHKGPAKGLKEPQTSKCSKYRRIDRICGERQPRRRADAHTHTHKISLLHFPNYLATAENEKAADSSDSWSK